MGTTIKPVSYIAEEKNSFLNTLEETIKKELGKDADLILNHPVVYVHVWQTREDQQEKKWSIYVGETNDIIGRTKEHWAAARIVGNWQHNMLDSTDPPTVFFFGHKLFHKSLTLDIENRLIDFFIAMENAHSLNGRGNPQGCYSGDENLDSIFNSIWNKLRKNRPNLFPTQQNIVKSAIYKASPNHKLTSEQREAKRIIISRVKEAVEQGRNSQIVFIKGEAGTGKTVLTSSAFFEILEADHPNCKKISGVLLVNHNEQLSLYQNMAIRLGYDKPNDGIIMNPTRFLNTHSVLNSQTQNYEPDPNNIVDVVFVDEAHLLWNQNGQGFNGRYGVSQLDEIMKRARVTVIMYDENQILDKRQIADGIFMQEKENIAKSQGPDPSNGECNFFEMRNQLRMKCADKTMEWIDSFTKNLKIGCLALDNNKDKAGYEIKVFDTLKDLHNAIRKKAKVQDTKLSRVIATYDWEYNKRDRTRYWNIEDQGYQIPWNGEYYRANIHDNLSRRQRRRISNLAWSERDYTVEEAGSTFTIQGFDLSFAGVVLGPSVCFDENTGTITFDESKRAWDNMRGNRILPDGTTINVTHTISMHELRVLMTRGTKGLYIYACNDGLRKILKESLNN